MTYSYLAYGLNIQSEIELPELLPHTGQPDVYIRINPDYDLPNDALTHTDRWIVYGDSACVQWGEIGFFNVERRGIITAKPSANIEPTTLTNFIVTIAMSMLLHQRGLLILHASAVAIEGKAVAFVGQSGWGKSTLAAALVERGHTLITDDILVVDFKEDTQAIVIPAFPQIKLWPDSLESLGDTPDTLPRIHSSLTKRAKHLDDGFANGSLPLECIYVLDRGDEMAILPVTLQEAVRELLIHAHFNFLYSEFLLKMRDSAALQLKNRAKAASLVPMRRLIRRWQLDQLPETLTLVEQDFYTQLTDAASMTTRKPV